MLTELRVTFASIGAFERVRAESTEQIEYADSVALELDFVVFGNREANSDFIDWLRDNGAVGIKDCEV